MVTRSEKEYANRERLRQSIMGQTGRLDGESRGLWALNTLSLEKLYQALVGPRDPAKTFKEETS